MLGDLVIVLEAGGPGAAGSGSGAAAPGGPGAAGFGEPVPLAEARVPAADLAVTRGDGVFESIGVVGGRFIELERHLARLAHSSRMLELAEPDLAAFEAAARAGVAAHAAHPELLVKLFHSRGVEGGDRASGWVEVLTGPDHRAARENGVRAVTLDRGYRSDIAQTAPWLLQGAKTLSYALNKAALREAARRGADDVVFVSTDDVVLEGPTSSVLVRHGDVFRTPRTDLGILAGTTQAAVFGTLADLGFEAREDVVAPAELASADGLWLLSSGRLVAPVRELDGAPLPVDSALTAELLARTFGVPVATAVPVAPAAIA